MKQSPSSADPAPLLGLAARRAMFPGLLWSAFLLLTVILSGFSRPDWFHAIYVAVALGIAAGELLFIRAIFRRGRKGLWLGWKKFTGYAIPLFYAAHALPRVEWAEAGLASEGRVAWLFSLTLVATILGSFLFWLQGRPAALADAGVISPEEAADPALRKKKGKEKRKRGLLAGLLDWVDALAWAAIAVLVVNFFIFQLYVVPSESMVPTFLAGDRPFTLKLTAGPRVPLTEWRLPFVKLPARGDVITIANPRYADNQGVSLKKYFSQFVYMLTFTTVNLDKTLPDGSPKADPLVKRVVGEPGERLLMADDDLWVMDRGASAWRKVEEPWRKIDLWKEPAALKAKIASIPLDEATRRALTELDAWKNGVDVPALAASLAARGRRIEALARSAGAAGLRFVADGLPRIDPGQAGLVSVVAGEARAGGQPFGARGPALEDLALTGAILSSPEVLAALRSYAEGGLAAASIEAADPYLRGARALSLLIKDNLLGRIERDLELVAAGSDIEAYGSDARRARLTAETSKLRFYLLGAWDMRNFPAFPEKGPLAADEYFAIGDNRYNSFDFRFIGQGPGEYRERALDPADPQPVRYLSALGPMAVKLRFIEGYALFRLWPPSRMGLIR
jgi:signal peptidase I